MDQYLESEDFEGKLSKICFRFSESCKKANYEISLDKVSLYDGASLVSGGKYFSLEEMRHHQFVNIYYDKNEVLEIYCRVLINSFNIMNDDYQSIGIGLYLSASVLDHSCDPNATVLFEGKNLILRTIKDVKKFEDLRISYTHLLGNVCFLLCISVLSVGFFKKCKKMPEDILENTRKYYVIGKRKEKHMK